MGRAGCAGIPYAYGWGCVWAVWDGMCVLGGGVYGAGEYVPCLQCLCGTHHPGFISQPQLIFLHGCKIKSGWRPRNKAI